MTSVRLNIPITFKRCCQCFLAVFFAFALVACAKPPRYKIVKPSKAKLREDYIGLLQDHGVQVAIQGETAKLIIPDALLFNPRSANFNQCANDTLDRIGGYLPLYETSSIKVAGYTDDEGSMKFLKLLSARQAQVVADRLWPNGIGSSMVFAEGYGPSYPIARNNSDTNRELNRRVEMSFKFYRTLRPYD